MIKTLFLASILIVFGACTTRLLSGNGLEGSSTIGNPFTAFAVAKYDDVNGLTVCMDQMTLEDVNGKTVKVPFALGKETVIPPTGVDLKSLSVPSGQYTKISLNLADVCGTGRTLVVNNDQGTFKTSSPLVLKFVGNNFLGSGNQKIIFDLQLTADNLSDVQSDSEVANQAQADTGNYYSSSCGMQTNSSVAAFCETFDQPSATVSRSGQLNSSTWSVSRLGGNSNLGGNLFDNWSSSTMSACNGTQPAKPDGSDVIICNGQARESINDNGQVNSLAMSLVRPFDFTNRTGTVSFDVTNDTSGSHGVWPEFWLSDQPTTGPLDFGTPNCGLCSFSQNGFVIRFNGNFVPFQGNMAPNCPSDNQNRWIVGSVGLIQNYTRQEIGWLDNSNLEILGCVVASNGPNSGMNHVELHISQNQVDILATDAGSSVLKPIARINKANLGFTKGFVSLVDAHNDAAGSSNPSTANHTFAWDNVAFDGPVSLSNLNFNVLDSLTATSSSTFNLGWASSSGPISLQTLPITAANIAAATSAQLIFNFRSEQTPITNINYTVNGQSFKGSPVFSTSILNFYSIVLPVPLSALKAGAQSITISGNDIIMISNVDIVLVGAAN